MIFDPRQDQIAMVKKRLRNVVRILGKKIMIKNTKKKNVDRDAAVYFPSNATEIVLRVYS